MKSTLLKKTLFYFIVSTFFLFNFNVNVFSYEKLTIQNNIEGRWKVIKEKIYFTIPEIFQDKMKSGDDSNIYETMFKSCRFSNDKFYWTENKSLDSTNYILKGDTLIFLGKRWEWWNSVAIQIISIKKSIMTINIISKEEEKIVWFFILKRQNN